MPCILACYQEKDMHKVFRITLMLLLFAFTSAQSMNRQRSSCSMVPHRAIQRLLVLGGVGMASLGFNYEQEELLAMGSMFALIGATLSTFDMCSRSNTFVDNSQFHFPGQESPTLD